MLPIYRLHLLCILLASLSGILPVKLWGQEAPDFHIRFSPYPLYGKKWDGIFYQNGDGSTQRVNILNNPGIRSPSLVYSGGSPLRFFCVQANEEGVMVPVEVASVALDPDVREYLLMFVDHSGPGSSIPRYSIAKMDDGVAHFPAGNMCVFNAYPETLYVAYGKERLTVPAGGFSSPVRIPSANAGGADVAVIRVESDGTPISLYRSRWHFDENNREVVILSGRNDFEKLKITKLTQRYE